MRNSEEEKKHEEILFVFQSATEYLRNAQRNSVVPDLNGATQRNQVLNHVILAEINFFQKAKVNDLKAYIKTLLDEQVNFYETVFRLFEILVE